MARKAEEARSYPFDINYFAERCRAIESANFGMSLKSENPTDTGVWFRIHHEMTRRSYGEKITVTMTRTASGTDIHILSQVGMPTQLTDGGTNKKNVDTIFEYLELGLTR